MLSPAAQEMSDDRSKLDGVTGNELQMNVPVAAPIGGTFLVFDSKVQQADDGDVKPKTPRKRAAKKAAAEQNDAADKTPLKTPKEATPAKTPKEATPAKTPKTPKEETPRKRAPKALKLNDGDSANNSLSVTPQKRGSAEMADGKDKATPAKKRSPAKNPYPTNRSELSDADRMMVKMKQEGKGWVEISAAYSKITGEPLGKSTLSNRYPKIMAALFEWNEGDIERMLHVKDVVEREIVEEIAEFKKRAENDLWKRIAGRIGDYGGGSYSAEAIEKGYMKEKKDGFPHRATVDAVIKPAPVDGPQAEPSTDSADNSNSDTINAAAASDTEDEAEAEA